jgi:hypothetical protein
LSLLILNRLAFPSPRHSEIITAPAIEMAILVESVDVSGRTCESCMTRKVSTWHQPCHLLKIKVLAYCGLGFMIFRNRIQVVDGKVCSRGTS